MSDIDGTVAWITAQETILSALEEKKEAAQDSLRQALTILRGQVDMGGTTGDPIQDYLVSKFGVIGADWGERYHLLNGELRGRAGQAMLLGYTVRAEFRHNIASPSSWNDYEMQPRCALAVLESDALLFDRDSNGKMRCSLPVRSYAEEESGRRFDVIREPLYEYSDLDSSQRIPRLFFPQTRVPQVGGGLGFPRDLIHHLTVGNDEVRAWLERQLRYNHFLRDGSFERLLEQLGQLTLTPPAETAVE